MSKVKVETLANAADSKEIPVDTIVAGSAKAWINFNGSGTVVIRDSFNVTSIVDNGVGDYSVNIADDMPNSNYCVVSNSQFLIAGGSYATDAHPYALAVGSFGVQTCNGSGTPTDAELVTCSVLSN